MRIPAGSPVGRSRVSGSRRCLERIKPLNASRNAAAALYSIANAKNGVKGPAT